MSCSKTISLHLRNRNGPLGTVMKRAKIPNSLCESGNFFGKAGPFSC